MSPGGGPVAVVGLGCRFPGGATDPATYWTLLHAGADATGEVPASRWASVASGQDRPVPPARGAFLAGLDRFDARFFGVSAPEAEGMDPQQRLLLEVAWEALEYAGIVPASLEGTRTGVFLGVSTLEYGRLQTADLARIDGHTATGNLLSTAAGRVAHLFGLRGPALAVDTACSSSLVAVHLAVGSLRAGDCDLALAAGVNVLLDAGAHTALSRAGVLAPDGRCKTFDASADGYGRGEGCGVVVLERLADAVHRGDPVLGVVSGTAVNHNGRGNGLAVPNARAQQEVVAAALADASARPAEIDYVEAHGSGTLLGDRMELHALGAVLADGRPAERPLLVGSVKANIGHLEPAAGIAGFIKTVLALRHEEIPPHPLATGRSPHVRWRELRLDTPVAPLRWPRDGRRRLAGVSSFGIGGTNAHVIVGDPTELPAPGTGAPPAPDAGEPPAPGAPGGSGPDRPGHLFVASARGGGALRDAVQRHVRYLDAHPDVSLPDLAYTSTARRTHFRHRLAVPVDSVAQLRTRLVDWLADPDGTVPAGQDGVEQPGRDATEQPGRDGAVLAGLDSAVLARRLDGARPPRIAFAFTGQGSQYPGMGLELYRTEPTFRRALEHCRRLACEVVDPGPYEGLALFATEYALAELWRSWGVTPAAVLGHSLGEYVAACTAGTLALPDAVRLVAERERLMHELPPGAMAAVTADAARLEPILAGLGAEVCVAAVNGARDTVLSGPPEAVRAALVTLAAAGISGRELATSRAFHSSMVDPMLDRFERVAARMDHRPARVPIVSTVTGRLAAPGDLASAGYWRRNTRDAVQFGAAVRTLTELECDLVLEIGPHPVLGTIARHATGSAPARPWLASLHRRRGDWAQLLESLAAVYVYGAEVDWAGFDRHHRREIVALPTYPFRRDRYWRDTRTTASTAPPDPGHPLLGCRLHSPAIRGVVYATRVRPDFPSLLRDWEPPDAPAVPPGALTALALAAAAEVGKAGTGNAGTAAGKAQTGKAQTTAGDAQTGMAEIAAGGDGPVVLTDVTFAAPLALSDQPREVQTILDTDASGGRRFEIVSSAVAGPGTPAPPDWTVHVSGTVGDEDADRASAVAPALAPLHARCPHRFTAEQVYQRLTASGHVPRLRWITEIRLGTGEALVGLAVPEEVSRPHRRLPHPGLIESCLRAAAGGPYVATRIGRLRYVAPPSGGCWCHIRTVEATVAGQVEVDLTLVADDGTLLAELTGVRLSRVTPPGTTASDTTASDTRASDTTAPGTTASGSTTGAAIRPRPEELGECVPPRTAVERILVEIWQERFAFAPVGITDDFLLLGGDSIHALQIAAAALHRGIRLPHVDLLTYPNIEALGAVVTPVRDDASGDDTAAPAPPATGPAAAGRRPGGLTEEELDRLVASLAAGQDGNRREQG